MYLESQDFRLNETERLAVDFDDAFALFAVGDSGCGLLFAEALDALSRRHIDGSLSDEGVDWGVCDKVVDLRGSRCSQTKLLWAIAKSFRELVQK